MSRVIRRLTGEPVSHCAIELGGWVIHSNLLGLHMEMASTFRRSSQVLFEISSPLGWSDVLSMLQKNEGRPYDFGAFFYLGLRCLLPRLPKKNLWQSSGMFLCTEWVTAVLSGNPDSMITPYKLYMALNSKQENEV